MYSGNAGNNKVSAQVRTAVLPERADEAPANMGTPVNQGSRISTSQTGARPAQLALFTTTGVGIPDPGTPPTRPEFCRLPRHAQRCPHTGLSRSALNELILPTAANGFRPPVKSFVLRRNGARTGIRIISYASLVSYILDHEDRGGQPGEAV